MTEIRTFPVPFLFSFLKLAVLFLVFRWWRKNADRLLLRLYRAYVTSRPQSVGTRIGATLAWYARRVRKPIEWIVLLSVSVFVIADADEMPELHYVKIMMLWALGGSFVMRWVDAVATRQGDKSQGTAELRLRSLRVVGWSIVGIGLTLSLTSASVGRGAIYNWVISSCWVLSIPIVFLLVVWWRPIVLQRAQKSHNPIPLIRWVSNSSRGPRSYVAAAVGGVYLLYVGLRRYFVSQLSELSVAQRLLAYSFRREVEKQAESRGPEAAFTPLPEETTSRLRMRTEAEASWVSTMDAEVALVRELAAGENHGSVAVVGERGLGKTTFLDRVLADLPTSDAIRVDCPLSSFDAVFGALAEAFDCPIGCAEAEVIEAIEKRNTHVIAIDNVHRLVRPLIGGLADMDALTAFTRKINAPTTWVFTLDAPSWQYLRRARGDRAIFDQQIVLRPWSEQAIIELIHHRCAAAEIKPRYDDLVVPRQADAQGATGVDQTERDYIRILWDYADGNPTIALLFFAQSLVSRNGTIMVRLFKAPSAAELEDLPESMYFVLRAIVQLDEAYEQDVVACTYLHPSDVADALRSARTRGLVRSVDQRVTVTMQWYRAVTRVLQRRHLLLRAQ